MIFIFTRPATLFQSGTAKSALWSRFLLLVATAHVQWSFMKKRSTNRIVAINEDELSKGIAGTKNSWHRKFEDQAWIFIGGLSTELSEGDIICVFSQFGEVEEIKLMRDKHTGKSRGFGFLKYSDARSTILAVDNFNGTEILHVPLVVDHTEYTPQSNMVRG